MFRFISIYRKNIKNSSINRIGKTRDFLSLSILRHKNHPAKVWEKFDYAILRKFFSFLWMDLLFELLIHNRKIVQVSLETKFNLHFWVNKRKMSFKVCPQLQDNKNQDPPYADRRLSFRKKITFHVFVLIPILLFNLDWI